MLHLTPLARDRVRRAAMVVDLTVEGPPDLGDRHPHVPPPLRLAPSLRRPQRASAHRGARPDAVLLGDMNLWGPPVRVFLPGWHRAVKGPTWPAWNPHSQIDHILVRGALESWRARCGPTAARTTGRCGPSWPCDNHPVFHTDLHLLARVAIGSAVAFVFGFERQLRGSPAGDRTFVLIGGAATAGHGGGRRAARPRPWPGSSTGLGFIGAGWSSPPATTVRGLTTAATVFAVAGIGIVIGYGHMLPGSLRGRPCCCSSSRSSTSRSLRFLDAGTYAGRFANDRPIRPGNESHRRPAPPGGTPSA